MVARALVQVDAMSEWIKVNDRLPENDAVVLCFTDGTVEIGAWSEADDLWWDCYHDDEIVVTHWIPLPAPPQDAA